MWLILIIFVSIFFILVLILIIWIQTYIDRVINDHRKRIRKLEDGADWQKILNEKVLDRVVKIIQILKACKLWRNKPNKHN